MMLSKQFTMAKQLKQRLLGVAAHFNNKGSVSSRGFSSVSKVDYLVIGAGSGGIASARRAA